MSIEMDIYDGKTADVISALNNGLSIDFVTDTGDPLLVAVVFRGNIDLLKELIQRKVNIEARDTEGGTALHWAALGERADCLELLLRAGADIEAIDEMGNSPIYSAIAFDRFDNCKLLIEAGASLSRRNSTGETPLHWCELRGAGIDIREMLIASGADTLVKDNHGHTPSDLKQFADPSVELRNETKKIQKMLRDTGI